MKYKMTINKISYKNEVVMVRCKRAKLNINDSLARKVYLHAVHRFKSI